MFENAGEKLKTLGYVSFVLGILGSVIFGIALFDYSLLLGIIAMILGVVFSWISVICIMAISEAATYAKAAYKCGNRTASNNPMVTLAASRPSENKNPEKKNFENGWTCSCGEVNTKGDYFCKSCGKYR